MTLRFDRRLKIQWIAYERNTSYHATRGSKNIDYRSREWEFILHPRNLRLRPGVGDYIGRRALCGQHTAGRHPVVSWETVSRDRQSTTDATRNDL